MENLQIQNPHLITYKDDYLTIDVLGGVDSSTMERMVCTLRLTHKQYTPHRTTLDLYSENQIDKLLRTLCDKWELQLMDVSQSVHKLIMQLEQWRLQQLMAGDFRQASQFTLGDEEKNKALKTLKSKDLLKTLAEKLDAAGIIGEDENAVILFLALASYKFSHPFSVLCLAKSGIGKSYILQKLSECMPNGSYSFHTQISANALYYFNSCEIQNKALLIEDLEWTAQMLTPLATLQSQGKLVKTQATKDKDGMLHSTTFEVVGNLCLLACAYSDRNYERMSLPFLCIHLNHSHAQDMAVMDYQKKCKAGKIAPASIQKAQHELKCLIASLEPLRIVNPYATAIQLPEDVAHPRKSLLLLLNFIEVITYFFQWQRHRQIDKQTGEECVMTHPDDIEIAFKYLKNSLFRRADELSTSARGFYHWLAAFLSQAKTKQFTALDIRRAKAIHPRTLNRYLQELKLYSYVQVVGGNKHREGYRYKLTDFGSQTEVKKRIENDLNTMLNVIKKEYEKQKITIAADSVEGKPVSQSPVSNSQTQDT